MNRSFKKFSDDYTPTTEQSSASDPHHIYLSISTPLLSQGTLLISHGLSHHTREMVKEVNSDVVEIVEPPKEGYQLTLRLKFHKIPRGKGLVILNFHRIPRDTCLVFLYITSLIDKKIPGTWIETVFTI